MPWLIALILAPFGFLYASQEYIFSYKVAVRNSVVINEAYNFSKAMKKPEVAKILGECRFDLKQAQSIRESMQTPKNSPQESKQESKTDSSILQQILYDLKEDVLACFFHHGIGLRDDTTASKNRAKSTTTLIISPTPVVVEFKDSFVTMKIIQSKS